MNSTLASNQPRLTKRFALLAGAIIVAACLALAVIDRQRVEFDLQTMAERNNVALARAFSNVIWPRYTDFLRSAHTLAPDALRADPRIAQLKRDVLAQMNGLSVVKVKIYDLDGLTVFSTDSSQISEDKSDNAGFVSARAGHVVSELTHRDTFSAFEQTVEDLDVLSSYVPIVGPQGEIQGVFEVYNDVTALLQLTRQSQLFQLVVAVATFIALYLILIFVVWHNERRSQEQHRLNLRLAKAAAVAEESNRHKSEFLANMSHELRTPLNAVLGFSEALKSQLFGPVGSPRYVEYANDIWASGNHLLDIIDDILDISKIEAGQAVLRESSFEPAEVVADCIRMIEPQAREARINLVCELGEGGPRLWADERRVRQILLNVLSNAVKFTPAGGSVTIAVAGAAGGRLEITVSDTGVGIAPEDIAKVMAPFGRIDGPYSGRAAGTGLGLPIAKAFVALHGGTLDLISEPDQGTNVRIVFPPERVMSGLRPHDRPAARRSGAASFFSFPQLPRLRPH